MTAKSLPQIDVVTTARADYSMVAPIAQALVSRADVSCRVVFTGSHFSDNERPDLAARKSGITAAHAEVSCEGIGQGLAASGLAMAQMTDGFVRLWTEHSPDICLLLGDRFELMPPASVAVLMGVPLCHVFGGEEDVSYCFDTQVRNAVTKMAHVHLVMHEAQRRRLLDMGEEGWRIHVCGNPAVDDIAGLLPQASRAFADYAREAALPLKAPIIVACYLPPTSLPAKWREELPALLRALDRWPDHSVIWAGVNTDPESTEIQAAIERHCETHTNHRFIPNLGRLRYYGLLDRAALLVGNSSSGLLEAASFKLPVVNVGIRQTGRLCGDNVINVPARVRAIEAAIGRGLGDRGFLRRVATMANPFHRKGAARMMARIVAKAAAADRPRLLLKRTMAGNPRRMGRLQRVAEYPPLAAMAGRIGR